MVPDAIRERASLPCRELFLDPRMPLCHVDSTSSINVRVTFFLDMKTNGCSIQLEDKPFWALESVSMIPEVFLSFF